MYSLYNQVRMRRIVAPNTEIFTFTPVELEPNDTYGLPRMLNLEPRW